MTNLERRLSEAEVVIHFLLALIAARGITAEEAQQAALRTTELATLRGMQDSLNALADGISEMSAAWIGRDAT